MHRSASDRVVAGVAGGVGEQLRVDPVIVRVVVLILAFAGGVGVLVYVGLWALSGEPRDSETDPPPALTLTQLVAVALVVLGVLLLLRRAGLWFGDTLVWPVALAGAGSAVIWSRADERDRRWLTYLRGRDARPSLGAVETMLSGPVSPLRVLLGGGLIALAVTGFLAANDAFVALRDVGLALVAAAVGVALIVGPGLVKLARQLRDERRERIRSEERSEVAAHLHDSVLQTHALIQRSATEPVRMVSLARQQERELRAWLYGRAPDEDATLAVAVSALAAEVEQLHAVPVDVVQVGDAPLDSATQALVGALREATVNAAVHAGSPNVDVYVEAERDAITAFVRDRGRGFDPDAVPPDRQGIRGSIRDRLARHGGRSRITSEPGVGTEIELAVPRRAWSHQPHDHTPAPSSEAETTPSKAHP